MTEEMHNINREECICKNKYFKKFLAIAFGTFVGGFCAISLFHALHRPYIHPYAFMMMQNHKMHRMMENDAYKFQKDMHSFEDRMMRRCDKKFHDLKKD